ncbi:BTAD domain-containing putative transcriptional regulator [Micromonospora sp. NPDC048930]|uniref:AfsR/SARP family transcriptional regulator n=1 Tax=Micromonospora sp. NPDC048930 TaxID=3364261 RepID=UPI00371FC6B3
MRFRLLGPFAVEEDGRPVRLDGNRARCVLALLLLNPGTLVPVERIIDEVWGDAPPRSVRTQVHAQISVIRRGLRALPEVEVRTHATGYLLRVRPDEIDVAVFRQLTRQARAEAALGRPIAAAEAYRAALRLYAGPPLGDLDAPFARAEAGRLAEERLAALTELIGLDLAAGRHHELIPKLTTLVERHPLHEPLWRHLLVALHAAGRRSEAIACYRRARAVLRDELGLEPGRELSRAYRDLLASEGPLTVDPRGDALDRALTRLARVERMLRDIRRELELGEPSR